MPDREHDREDERDHLRQVDDGAEELEALLGRREREHPVERAAGRRPPCHQPEQDQRERERAHHLDERVARRERGAEHHSVEEGDGPAERDAGEEREPVRPARVVDHPVRDQGARGADGAEGEIEHPGGLIEHDDPDARQRVRTAERQAEHDVRLEELPIDAEHRERDDAIHRASGAL